jgi:hypothetical protein
VRGKIGPIRVTALIEMDIGKYLKRAISGLEGISYDD